MEALVPAFIAVFLAEFGGVAQRSAAARMAAGLGLVLPFLLLLGTMIFAAVGGYLVAPYMPIQARTLLVGLSLVAGALPLFVPSHRKPARPELGRFAMAMFGAGGPFIVFALAAQTGMPLLAGLGGLLGSLAVLVPHALSDKPLRQIIPLGTIRRVSGGVLLLIGFWISLKALGLI